MGFRIGIDTGGTFVDVVAVSDRGELHSLKTPTTPADPSVGVGEALEKTLRLLHIRPSEINSIFHGTTIATNTLLQHSFGRERLGLVVTQGCRYILEIARQTVPGAFGNMVIWEKPERLVYLENVREIRERLNYRGEVLTPLDEGDVREAAREFKARGIQQIAVSLLHSYVNPAHEGRVRDLIQEVYPQSSVSISSEILPEYREYERTLTTLLDVALRPTMSTYAERLEQCLKTSGVGAPVSYMKSNGGVGTLAELKQSPVSAVLSGPAAGVLAGAFVAGLAGFRNVITMDMGGTSTDICLVEDGRPFITTEGKVDIYPLKIPMVDVISIGAGGGSVAWLGAGNSLRVGPRSAGSHPGPACYGRGGVESTVTDAHLFLGRLPQTLLGGEVILDRERAATAIGELATRMGVKPEAAAEGILEIANYNMVGGIRKVSVERGRDPGDYYLVAFGGAGPLHASHLIEILRIRGAIIPPLPGTTSALGLLVTDLRGDWVQTLIARQDRIDVWAVSGVYGELERRAWDHLGREGVPPERRRVVRFADLRYVGQGYEVRVEVEAGEITPAFVQTMIERFHRAHDLAYGYCDRNDMVELVNLRVQGIGLVDRPTFKQLPMGDLTPGKAALKGSRSVYLGREQGFQRCPVYVRDELMGGNRLEGPAVIEQYDSTVFVPPGQQVRVDPYGNLILERIER